MFLKNSKNSHFTYKQLYALLEGHGNHKIDNSKIVVNKSHINSCKDCWNLWNQVRWDRAMQSVGVQELSEYLGSEFHKYFDSSLALANDWLKTMPHSQKEIDNFYKTTPHYLYNLTIWYESGDRDKFEQDFMDLINLYDVHSVMDYGCGVGNDGLNLLANGVDVIFVDFDNPSTKFLRWRLKKRKQKATILDVETLSHFPPVDMFMAIDVLEHMTNPLEVVEKLDDMTRVFVHRSEFSNTHNGRHPFHFSFNEMKLNRALSKKGFKNVSWPILSVWVRT